MNIKIVDIFVIIFFLSFLLLFLFFANKSNSERIFVKVNLAEREFFFALDKNLTQTFYLDSSHYNTLEINNEKVFISAATCLNKICMQRGEISKKGEWIACLPNQFFVSLVSLDESQQDFDVGIF